MDTAILPKPIAGLVSFQNEYNSTAYANLFTNGAVVHDGGESMRADFILI
jgi:hypothetical protein